MTNPTFTVYCGPMFSSKTSRLLMALERCWYQRVPVVAFKPTMDKRYAVGDIVTHAGWKHPAVNVATGEDILEYVAAALPSPHVVALDEAFMVPGSAASLVQLFKRGYSVVVSTLDLAANGKPFPEVTQLLPWATRITKCTAVCTLCGRDAPYTANKGSSSDEHSVQVGGAELYEPRCYEHYQAIKE